MCYIARERKDIFVEMLKAATDIDVEY